MLSILKAVNFTGIKRHVLTMNEQTTARQSSALFKDPLVQRLADFLDEIGIKTEAASIEQECFLPGIYINRGRLLVDEEKLLYPGDILHEAGHIAVMPAERRKESLGNVGGQDDNTKASEEMMAIAWSYAAAKYLDLPVSTVFHPDGYKGEADHLADTFDVQKQYIGLPMLQWIGLCHDEKLAASSGTKAYPHMLRWLRE